MSLLPGHPNAAAAPMSRSRSAPQGCHRILGVPDCAQAVFQLRAHKYFLSSADILIQSGVMQFASNWGGGGAAAPSLGWHQARGGTVGAGAVLGCVGAWGCGKGPIAAPGAEPPGDPQQCRGWSVTVTAGDRGDLAGDGAAVWGEYGV